jgi:LuxR family maltose regulon positive regulatory protein
MLGGSTTADAVGEVSHEPRLMTVASRASSVRDRPRLDGLYAGATGCVIRVVAPAGYGKSTLVRRWFAGDARVGRWLDLGHVDNDPVVMLDAVARGMADLFERPFAVDPASASDPVRLADEILPEFGAALAAVRIPFVLVFDEVQHLRSRSALAIMATVSANVPLESTVVTIGRSYPDDGSFAKLRLTSGVVDVTVDDLALDLAETEALLASVGVDVGLDELGELVETFEGWPAGLRLASIVMSTDRRVTTRNIEQLGELSFVTDFLRAEWLAHLDVEDRIVLREAACLGRFTARMCDEVLDRRRCAGVLRRLGHDQRVVVPLDRRHEWYGMHRLLERCLARELRADDPARWREVHLDAARWWEREGDTDRAIGHVVAAGDADRCERLIVQHAASYITAGRTHDVRRWLATLPTDFVRAAPRLCALEALTAFQDGDGEGAIRWLSVLRRPWPASSTPSWVDLVVASLSPRTSVDMLPMVEAALAGIEAGPWRAFALQTCGTLLLMQRADEQRAIAVLEAAGHEAAIAGAHTLQAECLAVLAVVADLRGDHQRSSTLADRAHQSVVDHSIDSVSPMALATAAHALAHARYGHRGVARDQIVDVRRRLIGLEVTAAWFNVLVRLALIRATLLLDAADEAADLLTELDHHMRLERDDSSLAEYQDIVRAQVEAARGVGADRSWTLSDAELRVLHHLPTNLSLADIATLLFVSRNTVKSHVAAIYRKLGTTSRSDTVRRAGEAGLLGERARRNDGLGS